MGQSSRLVGLISTRFRSASGNAFKHCGIVAEPCAAVNEKGLTRCVQFNCPGWLTEKHGRDEHRNLAGCARLAGFAAIAQLRLRLRTRMEKVGSTPNDRLFVLVCDAYDALHALSVELHYLSCESGVGRPTRK